MDYKKKVEYKGKKYSFTELVEITGISEMALRYRIERKGLSPEEAVKIGKSRKKEKVRTIFYKNKEYKITDFAKLTKLPYDVVYSRFDRGWTAEKIINTKYKQRFYKEKKRYKNLDEMIQNGLNRPNPYI